MARLLRDRIPDLRADCPSAENRRPSGATIGDLGNLPNSAPWGQRFESDLLCQTRRSHSTRSMRSRPAWPSPYRCESYRAGHFDRTPAEALRRRCRSSSERHVSHSVLCPVMRPPRVRSRLLRARSSTSLDQCLLYRTGPRELFFRIMEIVGVIPARFASTRLPGKALLSETGRPLIQHVLEAARRAQSLQRIIVATDDPRIAAAVERCGGEFMMTRADHATGTDRVAEVAAAPRNCASDREPAGRRARDLRRGPRPRRWRFWTKTPRHRWRRLPRAIRDESIYRDPACVKVVCSSAGRALYFSRSPIPHHRDGLPDSAAGAGPIAYLHLGLYAYRREFLLSLGKLPPSRLEAAEKLEQLRVLDAGIPDRRRDRR